MCSCLWPWQFILHEWKEKTPVHCLLVNWSDAILLKYAGLVSTQGDARRLYHRFRSLSCKQFWYLPLQPWIKKIVRRLMLNLATPSLLLLASSTSPDPLLVYMLNFVPTLNGLSGSFGLTVINPQRTPGCLWKQPYFP